MGCLMRKGDDPIVVEQHFNRPVETVWEAITEIGRMQQWFFENIPAFRAEVGFETQFSVSSGDRHFLHLWQITEVVPLKRIAYSWKYEEYPGEARVVFELFRKNDTTILRLTNVVIETFPDEIPEFRRESCIGGWKYFIQDRLKGYVEGREG